mgnify:CR=1 FL=1
MELDRYVFLLYSGEQRASFNIQFEMCSSYYQAGECFLRLDIYIYSCDIEL